MISITNPILPIIIGFVLGVFAAANGIPLWAALAVFLFVTVVVAFAAGMIDYFFGVKKTDGGEQE